jgi:hypothetical protein
LLGGEAFWDDIEGAIRKNTIKFVLVCSTNSINKPGVKNEISVATSVARIAELSDFIIPIRIDNVDYSDFPIEIFRLNAINFDSGWFAGLSQLIRKLEKDGVPRADDKDVVNLHAWTRSFLGIDADVLNEEESIISSILPLLPPYPNILIKNAVADQRLSKGCAISLREYSIGLDTPTSARPGELRVDMIEFLTNGLNIERRGSGITRKEARWVFQQLLDRGIERYMLELGLSKAVFSQRSFGYFHSRREGMSSRIRYTMPISGVTKSADVSGKSNKYGVHWHYAPQFGRVNLDADSGSLTVPLISHVIFSEDGVHPITDTARSHRLRRSYCKNWWQDRWRNLMLAFLSSVQNEDGRMSLPVAPSVSLIVGAEPLILTVPVSARSPGMEEAVEESWIGDADALVNEAEIEDADESYGGEE